MDTDFNSNAYLTLPEYTAPTLVKHIDWNVPWSKWTELLSYQAVEIVCNILPDEDDLREGGRKRGFLRPRRTTRRMRGPSDHVSGVPQPIRTWQPDYAERTRADHRVGPNHKWHPHNVSVLLLLPPFILGSDRWYTEIGQKAWLFAKLQPGRARKRINVT